jgi:hypothetical protein
LREKEKWSISILGVLLPFCMGKQHAVSCEIKIKDFEPRNGENKIIRGKKEKLTIPKQRVIEEK